MNERIRFNGTPVTGFVGAEPGFGEKALWLSPLVGLLGGAVGGGYLGSKSRYGTAVGAVAGGVAGAVTAPLLVVLIGSAGSARST